MSGCSEAWARPGSGGRGGGRKRRRRRRRAGGEEGKGEADTRSGAMHRWAVYVGPNLTLEGRLTLTQPPHLLFLLGTSRSLSGHPGHPGALHSWRNWPPSQAQLHLSKAFVLADVISSATLSCPTSQPKCLHLCFGLTRSCCLGNPSKLRVSRLGCKSSLCPSLAWASYLTSLSFSLFPHLETGKIIPTSQALTDSTHQVP